MNAYVKGEESTTLFRIELKLQNKIGMMKQVSEILYQMDINIDELHTKKVDQETTLLTLGLEIADYDYLIIDRCLERMRQALWEKLLEFRVSEIH